MAKIGPTLYFRINMVMGSGMATMAISRDGNQRGKVGFNVFDGTFYH